MKLVILSLFVSVMAQAATDTYKCTTDTGKAVQLVINYVTIQSLTIDGQDYSDSTATFSRDTGTNILVNNYRDGQALRLGMWRQEYQLGNGNVRKMTCTKESDAPVKPKPSDGL